MRRSREMRRLADTLMAPIRVPVPAEPEALFDAVVAAAAQWRGREIVVHRAVFPPYTASGLWLEGEDHDDVVIDQRAAVWHQIVIFCHEVWHMHQTPADGGGTGRAAARSDFTLADEQEADRFGMLMGRRLRTWLDASADSVYADRGEDTQHLAGRIGAALNYRGTR
ncbi:toxin [Streptomyces sp. NPDC058417]|uniref:toxin n=1 Tax=unclassified Streptomyces TaxID=2593676 RepID=UPI00366367C8